MRVVWALVALLCGGCGGDEDESFDIRPGARQNGEKCLFTGAGARVCSTELCLGVNQGSPFGVCSEPCQSSCRFGGECLEVEGLSNRVCLLECTDGSACVDELVCQPAVAIRPCAASGACESDINRFWCLPPIQ